MGSERDMSHARDDRESGTYPAYPASDESSRADRPPLTKRMRLVHWIAIDCAVGAFLAIIDAATLAKHFPVGQVKLPLVLLFMVAVFVPMGFRRRAPTTAFGALLILGVLLSGIEPTVPGTIFLGAAFVLYTVTVEGRKRTGVAALGLVLAVMVFLGVAAGGGPRSGIAAEFVPVALANVIAWMTGYSMRQRRLYVVTLQRQAANSAVAEERLRIARELHDVVAHSMSVIAVQAGYGQYVIDASPNSAKDALGAIQATSRDALEEMRRMLGVLRQQDVTPGLDRRGVPGQGQGDPEAEGRGPAGFVPPKPAPLAPAPGVDCLDKLIERTRGAGVRVMLDVSGHRRPAPASVDLSAYRIIQEALTNVVRHAGTGASCVVSVCYTDADLVIRVTDDGGLPVTLPSVSVGTTGSGHGLIGMRERVHLCRGTFAAGPLPNGGFQVTATLPLPASDVLVADLGTGAGPRAQPGPRAPSAQPTAGESGGQGGRGAGAPRAGEQSPRGTRTGATVTDVPGAAESLPVARG